jgi:hypothetical protein
MGEEKKNNIVDLALARFNRRGAVIPKEPAPVKPTPKTGVTVADVFTVSAGAKILGAEPTADDWAAIEAEAARWQRDSDGAWHQVERKQPERVCVDCSKDYVPPWRRGGKIVERIEADGARVWGCNYCGRRVGAA